METEETISANRLMLRVIKARAQLTILTGMVVQTQRSLMMAPRLFTGKQLSRAENVVA
jgi:hypothetical protein